MHHFIPHIARYKKIYGKQYPHTGTFTALNCTCNVKWSLCMMRLLQLNTHNFSVFHTYVVQKKRANK